MAELGTEEGTRLLWEEFKFRHQLFWSLYFRWGTALLALLLAPHVKVAGLLTDPISAIAPWARANFTWIALALTIVASWHLGAEYLRLQRVGNRYALAMARVEMASRDIPDWNPFGWRIGGVAVVGFLAFFAILSASGWLIPLLSRPAPCVAALVLVLLLLVLLSGWPEQQRSEPKSKEQ